MRAGAPPENKRAAGSLQPLFVKNFSYALAGSAVLARLLASNTEALITFEA
jgi:hypothetical protein